MTIANKNASDGNHPDFMTCRHATAQIRRIIQDKTVCKNHNPTARKFSGQETVVHRYSPMTDNQRPLVAEDSKDLPQKPEHILFIDDNEMLASLSEQLLTENGYQVATMTDSVAALKLFSANSERFDMVITDQTMPELTGKELIQEVKKIRSDIPTILCTGFSSEIDEKKSAQLGIDAFMMKPVDLSHMLQTIRRVLETK